MEAGPCLQYEMKQESSVALLLLSADVRVN